MSTQNPVFIPGPTNIPEKLRRAVDYPTIDHRSASFVEMLQPVLAGVRRVLKSKTAETIIFPSTGTGGWEAAITNTFSPGDKILAGRYGMFSHRWIDLCQRHKLDVEIVETEWGRGAPIEDYERILRADANHQIKAVLACHNETATGVKSDIAGVRAALDAARPSGPAAGRWRQFNCVDGFPHGRMGRRYRHHRIAEGVHAAGRARHRLCQPRRPLRQWKRQVARAVSSIFAIC